jgi:carbon-monoxide dehydrogenase large subunit
MTTYVGQRVERLEDSRLVLGRGHFTDDLAHDAAEVAFVRSSYAHARVTDIELEETLAIEGVHAIYAYEDLTGRFAQPLPVIAPHPGLVARRTQTALAGEEVRYVGEPIAMVVARDRYLAEDAAAGVRVRYEPLPAVVDLREAISSPGTAHSDMADNLAAEVVHETGDVAAALASAPHVFEWEFEIERSAAMPLEGRAVLARPDQARRSLLVHDSTQVPANVRNALLELFGSDLTDLHVVAPDIGGAFGMKGMHLYPEEVLVPWAAWRLRVPVKWTEDRREQFVGSNHERSQIHQVRVACDEEGRLLAFESSFVNDAGAYCPYGIVVPLNTATHLTGVYRIPNYRYELRSYYTNTVVTSPFRGAGRTQAAFVIERTMDRLARALGVDPAELRRRNLIRTEDFPYRPGISPGDGSEVVYDSGDYEAVLHLALEKIGYDSFGEERVRARRDGRRIGLGIACYVEGCGVGPYEGASVEVLPTGRIAVATGLSTQGQGHETVLAQIVADELGAPLETVHVTTGDTRLMPYSIGTFGSRAAVVAGSAAQRAAREVRAAAVRLAAVALAVEPERIELAGGEARVVGSHDALSLADLAVLATPGRHSFGERAERLAAAEGNALPGLRAMAWFEPDSAVYANGAHAVIVEIDPDACAVRFLRYVVVHDSGRVLNPLVVEGQIQGGVAQGVAGALYERIAYDEQGQPANASFMDFHMPYATEVPAAEQYHLETLSPRNELGVKGVGESGTIPAPAAIANALSDALETSVDRLPVLANGLHRLIEGASAR